MVMKTQRLAVLLALAAAIPAAAAAQSFEELLNSAGSSAEVPAAPAVSAPRVQAGAYREAQQYLPPNNDNPGFDWPRPHKSAGADYFTTGPSATFFKASQAQAEDLAEGTGKCALAPNTLYKTVARPGFTGMHVMAQLSEPLPGCSVTRGYIYMPHVSSTSAGGLWELPKNVRAFLDTLAYAEGTKEHYDYIFTFVTFSSYADHPRRAICSGSLCSTAAGRYQFLSKTWDALAADLGLTDFTPPSQEKACVELLRRAGAYTLAAKASKYENFSAAVNKINTIWASMPGSPYGQPTHTKAELWKVYKAALAKY